VIGSSKRRTREVVGREGNGSHALLARIVLRQRPPRSKLKGKRSKKKDERRGEGEKVTRRGNL